jgi:DnaJ-class molecular chaperone
MEQDYYSTLGVSRDASAEDIRKAYRGLAIKYHPDKNPNDASAKKKFQEVQSAFDVLDDSSKREMYDRYGSSFEQMTSGRPDGGRAGFGFQGAEDVDLSQFFGERYGSDPAGGFHDIFSQFARAGGRKARGAGGRRQPSPRGKDVQLTHDIPFNVAVQGGESRVSVRRPDGKVETIAVRIPAGVDDGKKIRLRGQGQPGGQGKPGAGDPGDLILTIHVAPHPYFTRRGNNLHVRIPIALAEAIEGGKIEVPTPKGAVALRVPPMTSGGTKLRIKGHGVQPQGKPAGDLIVEVQIGLPKSLGDEIVEQLREATLPAADDLRRDIVW